MPEFPTLRMALRALMANRLRSLLTVLGIVIGVAAVIALVALGQSATSRVESSVEGLGTNLLVITPGGETASGFMPPTQAPISLTGEQILAKSIPDVSAMAPVITHAAVMSHGTNSATIPIEATTAALVQVNPNLKPSEGTFLTAEDVAEARPDIVLGYWRRRTSSAPWTRRTPSVLRSQSAGFP